MSQSVAIDALPYYDHGYDEPGVREAAVKLVEEEMQRYRPTKDYLEEINLPAPGKTPISYRLEICSCGVSKISQFLERVLMEHVE